MRPRLLYTYLGVGALAVATGAGLLAGIGIATAQGAAAGAAALCAAAFFVPGLAFANYARTLRLRDEALEHVASLARDAGTIDIERLADELQVPKADAERILRKAVAEGRLGGRFHGDGRFVVDEDPRCPACGREAPSTRGTCASCGASLGG